MTDFWVGPHDDPDRIRLGPAAAAGAEGVLYRGYLDTADGPLQIAVKMLQPGHLDDLREWKARWRSQVELLVRLKAPGLVGVRGGFVGALPHLRGQADGSVWSLYLHMDWVEGTPLDRWARSLRSPEPEQLLGALVPVAAALDLLHSGAATDGVAVVHRDVKPANILIRPGGDTVLVDIGALRGMTGDTRRSGMVGTAGYIAPEVRTDGSYGPAGDRYSLGAVAFFLLTDHEPPPDAGIDELQRQLQGAPLLRGRHDVVDHVAAMLDPDPDKRPTSLANWVAQLRRSSLAVLPGDVGIAPRAPTRGRRAVKGNGPTRRRARVTQLRRTIALILSIGILLSGVLGWLILRASPRPSSTDDSDSEVTPARTVTALVFRAPADNLESSSLISIDIDSGATLEMEFETLGIPPGIRSMERVGPALALYSSSAGGSSAGVYLLPDGVHSSVISLGKGSVLESLTPDRLWLIRSQSQLEPYAVSLRELDMKGQETGKVIDLPPGLEPLLAVENGFIVKKSGPEEGVESLLLWTLSDQLLRKLASPARFLFGDVARRRIGWINDSDGMLHIMDTNTLSKSEVPRIDSRYTYIALDQKYHGSVSLDGRYLSLALAPVNPGCSTISLKFAPCTEGYSTGLAVVDLGSLSTTRLLFPENESPFGTQWTAEGGLVSISRLLPEMGKTEDPVSSILHYPSPNDSFSRVSVLTKNVTAIDTHSNLWRRGRAD